MWTSLILLSMLLPPVAPAVQADTVVAVERGTRIDVENWRGRVEVQAWDRDAVRIRTGEPGTARPDIGRRGAILRVRAESGADRPVTTDFTITVPRWMDVRVNGHQVDVSVHGTSGEVAVETVSGGIRVDGGSRVSVRTIMGAVTVRNTRGRVEVWTVNESVSVTDVVGDVSVETTNGGVTLTGIRSAMVRASTVNGAVTFAGTIQDDGRYAFLTHNGRIQVAMPETVNATVSAATYHGSFQADFPIRLTGMSRDRHYDFTLGSGSARIELESFNGDITLRRPR